MKAGLRRIIALAAAIAVILVAAILVTDWVETSKRDGRLDAVRSRRQDLNVILLSLDTTRADRLGCYGYEHAETPSIDEFAKAGVRFARAISHVPITLPSHSTVFTGSTPVVHGAHRHTSVLADEGNETLAEILSAEGYRTAAFIAASVLDRSFGADQGFEHYADDMGLEDSMGAARVERSAGAVLTDAKQWLRDGSGDRFFAFIHLYDPHLPYRPPSPYDRRHRDRPYDGEIAYMDSEVGDFLEHLEESGLLENTLIVMFGDHGESLGEHGIEGHSAFIYETMTWVPLLMSCPGLLPAGEVVDEQVGLIDVLPTILDVLGIEPPPSAQGVSLLPRILGRERVPARPAYIESHHLNGLFGWSPLLGVETERWKYIRAPRPELYDLEADPGELTNLFEARRDVASGLDDQLVELLTWGEGAPSSAESDELDPAMVEKLASLGYFGKTSERRQDAGGPGPDGVDPKDMWDTYLLYQRAFVASSYSRNDELRRALVELHELMPDNGTIRFLLARSHIASGRLAEAAPILEMDLRESPDDVHLNLSLGVVYGQLGRYDEAERCLRKVLSARSQDPKAMSALGSVYLSRGDHERAREVLQELVALDDADAESRHVALINLGTIYYVLRKSPGEAISYFERALALHPNSIDAHFYLAEILSEDPVRSEDAVAHATAFLSLSAPADERRAQMESVVVSLGRP